jgi:hypothetical protein
VLFEHDVKHDLRRGSPVPRNFLHDGPVRTWNRCLWFYLKIQYFKKLNFKSRFASTIGSYWTASCSVLCYQGPSSHKHNGSSSFMKNCPLAKLKMVLVDGTIYSKRLLKKTHSFFSAARLLHKPSRTAGNYVASATLKASRTADFN